MNNCYRCLNSILFNITFSAFWWLTACKVHAIGVKLHSIDSSVSHLIIFVYIFILFLFFKVIFAFLCFCVHKALFLLHCIVLYQWLEADRRGRSQGAANTTSGKNTNKNKVEVLEIIVVIHPKPIIIVCFVWARNRYYLVFLFSLIYILILIKTSFA